MQSHTIRLNAVWEPPDLAAAPTPTGGGGVWRRRFGRPTGLEGGLRVLLVVESPPPVPGQSPADLALPVSLMLNGTPLLRPTDGARSWITDITPLLAHRNELLLTPAAARCPAERSAVATNLHGRCDLPAECGRVSLQIVTAASGGVSATASSLTLGHRDSYQRPTDGA